MTKKEPREFWLIERVGSKSRSGSFYAREVSPGEVLTPKLNSPWLNKCYFKVIEHSAYEELKKENEELRDRWQRFAEANITVDSLEQMKSFLKEQL